MQTLSTWHRKLDGTRAARAQEVASQICDRLSDPDTVAQLIRTAATQSTHPMGWYGPSLAHGDAGLAVMHAARAAQDVGDGFSAQHAGRYLRLAAGDTDHVPLENVGVSAGTAGLLVAFDACAEVEPRWTAARDAYAQNVAAHIVSGPGLAGPLPLSDTSYDLVNGRAGTLAYLCSRRDAVVDPAIDRLVDDLVWVSGREDEAPHQWRWRSEVGSSVSLAIKKEDTADRCLNLSTSHGASGVVGALSAAYTSGIRRPGQRDAIEQLVAWIRGQASQDDAGPLWPVGIDLDEDLRELPAGQPSTQLAWCYGAAGMALAFHIAAEALDDDELKAYALQVAEGVWQRAREHTFMTPTLCHGIAGVLLIAHDFAARAPESSAARTADLLLDELVRRADPALPLVYQDREPPNAMVDQPAFLTGSTGVAATLLAMTSTARPSWLAPFLFR